MKISNKFLTTSLMILGIAALATISPEAMAGNLQTPGIAIPTTGQSIGDISANITDSIRGAGILVTALAYLGALTFGFMGALKWKAYGEQPDRTPLKVPVTYMAIAAILAALPEFLGTGVSTIWGPDVTVIEQP